MTEAQERLIGIIRSMPEELYNSGNSPETIVYTLAKKYFEIYGNDELMPMIEND